MAETREQPAISKQPLVVQTRVTPWGFLVALPLAAAFAYVGAWGLDVGLAPAAMGGANDALWLFSIPLLLFSLFLFLIGVGELARYVMPAVEIIVDDGGVASFGTLGARRISWANLSDLAVGPDQITLRGRVTPRGVRRELRLHFNRLAIDPAVLVARIAAHRPDLAVRSAIARDRGETVA